MMVLSVSTAYLGLKKPFPIAQLRQRLQDQLCSDCKLQVTSVMVKALPSGTRAAKAAFEVQLVLDCMCYGIADMRPPSQLRATKTQGIP